MGQTEAHAAKMLDVMFSWRGAVTLLASGFMAMIFRSPWLVSAVGVFFIVFWIRLVLSTGVTLKAATHDFLERLMPVRTDSRMMVFSSYFERFRIRFVMCVAVFAMLLVVAGEAREIARWIDTQTSLSSEDFSMRELLISAGVMLPWFPAVILIAFFTFNTLISLIQQVVFVEAHDGFQRIALIVSGVMFTYGFFESDSLYWLPITGAMYVAAGLAVLLVGKWVMAGFTPKKPSDSAITTDEKDE